MALATAVAGEPDPACLASAVNRGLVGPLASLYVFERLFHAITDPTFLSLIVVALLGGGACEDALPSELQSPGAPSQWQSPAALLSRLQYTPTVYRATVLGMLRGADVQLAAAGTRVLASLLRNGAVDEQLLELAGLLPRRRKKQRQLLAALTGDGGPSASPAAAAPAISVRLQPAADGSVRLEFVMPQGRGWQPPRAGDAAAPGPASRAAQQQQQESPGHDAAAREARQASPAARAASSSPALSPLPSGSRAASAEASFQEIVEALLALLSVELLPPVSLGAVGWLLNQLLAVGATGAQLHPAQYAALEAALQRRRSAVLAALQGPWCDALVPIASREWARQLQAITRTGAGSVHTAVHTWMQAVLVQELHWQLGTAPQAVADANAVAGAKLAYLSTASLVGVTQIMQLLCRGEVAPSPPCPSVTEADVRASEIPARAQVSLSQRLHCTVAFVRGEERAVVFGVEGVPGHVKAESQDLSRLKPAALHAVAACAPVAVVADPGAQPTLGLVLSTAPLMGTCPFQDEAQPRWLHVEVRCWRARSVPVPGATVHGLLTPAPRTGAAGPPSPAHPALGAADFDGRRRDAEDGQAAGIGALGALIPGRRPRCERCAPGGGAGAPDEGGLLPAAGATAAGHGRPPGGRAAVRPGAGNKLVRLEGDPLLSLLELLYFISCCLLQTNVLRKSLQ